MQLLHRHRRPSVWTPRAVPLEPLEVDWSHPLSAGLIGCYVPGGFNGLSDLANIGPDLNPDPSGAFAFTPEGPGYACIHPNAAAFSTVLPASWQLTRGGTLFWRGTFTGPTTGNNAAIALWGVIQSTSGPTPQCCYAIATTFDQSIEFRYCSADTSNAVTTGLDIPSQMFGLPVAIAVTFSIAASGPITMYVWSVNQGVSPLRSVPNIFTGTWAGGLTPDYTQSPQPSLGADSVTDDIDDTSTVTTSAYLYNEILPASQIMALNNDPFAMLRPRVPLLRNTPPSAGNPFRRWNRTYLVR